MNSIMEKQIMTFQKYFVNIEKVGKYLICLFFLLIANNIVAQTPWSQHEEFLFTPEELWVDSYWMPNAPGHKELEKALAYQKMNDKKNVRIWYEKSAKKGNLCALTKLAEMMLKGEGGEADIERGLKYLNRAAEQGYVMARCLLGMCHQTGQYVAKDIGLAVEYYQMCVYQLDRNYPLAKMLLGQCYINGIGTVGMDAQKDILEGIKLLKDIATSYNPQNQACQLALGAFYYNNVDFRNYEEAAKWFLMAASNSNWEAQNNLAYMYAKGEGVKQDYAKAHALIKDANYSATVYTNDPEELAEIQSSLLGTEGAIYLMENKADEAMSIWNQIKQKYPELIEKNKYNPQSRFIRIMYKQEQDAMLASKTNAEQVTPAIISDVDERIPENSIVGSPTFAVIIANENYKEVEGAPYAIHDGEIFKQYCEKTLGIPKSNIKFETDATFNSIKRQLNWLGQVMDVYQGEANIIFYYAGHGIPDEKNQSAYLLPVDGYGSDVTTGYNLDKLYADLSEKPAKSVVVLLDACFSGAKRDGGMLASARGVAIKAKHNAPKGNMVVFSAAQGDETAYPYKEKGHGMFTYYLMKKLQETKGDVTFGELADYVTSEVKKQSIVVNGKLQTPLVSSSSSATDWQNWKLR